MMQAAPPPGQSQHQHPHPHPHGAGPVAMPAGPPPVPDADLTLLPLSLDLTPLSPTPVKFSLGETIPAGFSAKDLEPVNELARVLLTATNPDVVFPPPPQPVVNERSKKVAGAKEAGNVAFKKGQWHDAIKLYTMSADIAASRPVFEANVYARDELALALANRSAAYTSAGEYVNALVDAEAVIQLKRPWIKGHFRKGKALAAMHRFEEAREAFLLGLQFDPTAEELRNAVNDVEEQIRQRGSHRVITEA
ncbi:hypothetical protein JCM3774_001487 [Rhodotorula dairenensis]